MTRARYTRQELDRLQLGWLVREQPGGGETSTSSMERAKARARQNHQQKTDEMLRDLGFE